MIIDLDDSEFLTFLPDQTKTECLGNQQNLHIMKTEHLDWALQQMPIQRTTVCKYSTHTITFQDNEDMIATVNKVPL